MRLGRHCLAIALFLAGCDDGEDPPRDGGDPGVDAGPNEVDSGGVDAGPPVDAGPRPDAGPQLCGSLTLPALTFEDVAAFDWEGSPYFPVGIEQPLGSDDLYVVDQRGAIVIVRDGEVLATPFLDIGPDGLDRTDFGGRDSERGLLGLAFHPEFATNGQFFVYYTSRESGELRNVVAEYHASGDVADTGEVRRLIDEMDPFSNHNGGQIEFGPDGFLYVGMGDGGEAGDPGNRALDLASMFGKLHRLDVNEAGPRPAAAGNPFEDTIWAYGLRNPWRFSFDRLTNELYIADVGQNAWEEINVQPAGSAGGENYGWSAYEGTHVFRAGRQDQVPVHTEPVFEYPHFDSGGVIRIGCSISGGFVYRGSAIPDLQGWYLFGDYCSNDRAAFKYCEGSVEGLQRIDGLSGTAIRSLVSFGEDANGELYMLGDFYVIRIVAP